MSVLVGGSSVLGAYGVEGGNKGRSTKDKDNYGMA